MDISDLLERAKARLGTDSDRQLAKYLSLASSQFRLYRKGWTYPSDATLLKLAELLDEDPLPLLIEGNIARSEGEVAAAYSSILQQLSHKSSTDQPSKKAA